MNSLEINSINVLKWNEEVHYKCMDIHATIEYKRLNI